MKIHRLVHVVAAGVLLLAVSCATSSQVEQKAVKLKVLIVDGQNNHNWKGTTPVLKAIL